MEEGGGEGKTDRARRNTSTRDQRPRLILVLRNGGRIEVEFSPKVYELVKRLLRRVLEPQLARCRATGEGSNG